MLSNFRRPVGIRHFGWILWGDQLRIILYIAVPHELSNTAHFLVAVAMSFAMK